MIQIDHYTVLGPHAEHLLNRCAKEFRADGTRLVSEECSFNPLRMLLNVFRKRQTREWTA